jgi:transmembrane sensor
MKRAASFASEEQAQRIGWLIAGYLQQRLNDAERDELDAWITASDANQVLFEELISPAFTEKGIEELNAIDTAKAYSLLLQRLEAEEQPTERRFKKATLLSIAASIVLLISVVVIYQMTLKTNNDPKPVAAQPTIQPGGNYATIISENGKQVLLAGLRNGLIDSLDGVEVLKTGDGQISYLDNQHVSNSYHVLHTPIGGQYRLTLPDGSRVWLNAGSSIRFPVRFDGAERKVELTGEGYFEIVPAAQLVAERKSIQLQPFRVVVNDVAVEVLGTHFNVSAYADENSITTTLLEGKVGITRNDSKEKVILQPGEQAIARDGAGLRVERLSSTEAVTAWKDGLFDFRDVTIEQIMQQAKRWYSIDTVVYKAKISKRFDAEILRSEPIEKLLALLEMTGGVHFKIEKKTIYVLP